MPCKSLLIPTILSLALARFSQGSTVTVPTTLPDGWSVLKPCAVDTPERVLKGVNVLSLADNTPFHCAQTCASQGYIYAGVEYGSECHCGRAYEKNAAATALKSDCNMPCAGDPTVMCGSGWRIQLYVGEAPTPQTLPAGWTTEYTCAVDSGARILANVQTFSLDSNTPATCTQYCQDKGFPYAGIEYGRECHCGTGYKSKPQAATDTDCYFPCPGNSVYNCGGDWRIQLYKIAGGKLPISTTSTSTPLSLTSTSTTASSTPSFTSTTTITTTLTSSTPTTSSTTTTTSSIASSTSTTTTTTTTTSSAPSTAPTSLLSGNEGYITITNTKTGAFMGYVSKLATSDLGSYQLTTDRDNALYVSFSYSTQPNVPFQVLIGPNVQPSGYSWPVLGAVAGWTYSSVQGPNTGEQYDELVPANTNPFGPASKVGSNFDIVFRPEGTYKTESAIWLFDPSTKTFSQVWYSDEDVAYPLYSFWFAPDGNLYFGTDLKAWATGIHADIGDQQITFKLDGTIQAAAPNCAGYTQPTYTSAAGATFDIQCSKDFAGTTLQCADAGSLTACIDTCGKGCAGVTWNPATLQCCAKSSMSSWMIQSYTVHSATKQANLTPAKRTAANYTVDSLRKRHHHRLSWD